MERFENREKLGACWKGIAVPSRYRAYALGPRAYLVDPQGKRVAEFKLVKREYETIVREEKTNSRDEIEFDSEGNLLFVERIIKQECMEYMLVR